MACPSTLLGNTYTLILVLLSQSLIGKLTCFVRVMWVLFATLTDKLQSKVLIPGGEQSSLIVVISLPVSSSVLPTCTVFALFVYFHSACTFGLLKRLDSVSYSHARLSLQYLLRCATFLQLKQVLNSRPAAGLPVVTGVFHGAVFLCW